MSAVIVGGNISGLITAISLKRIGISASVVEARNVVTPRNQLYTGLWNPAVSILSKLGIYEDIKQHMHPMRTISFKNQVGGNLVHSNSPLELPFEHPSFVSVRSDILVDSLLSHLQQDVTLNFDVSKVYRNKSTAVVESSDGKTVTGDFIVAADGQSSIVRRCLFPSNSTIPQGAIKYTVYSGHTAAGFLPETISMEDMSLFCGYKLRFGLMPTQDGVAWYIATKQQLQQSHADLSTLVDSLGTGWYQSLSTIVKNTDGGSDGIAEHPVRESPWKYKGWEALLLTDHGSTAEEPVPAVEPINTMRKTSMSDAIRRSVERIQTAPLVFYVGDAAASVDPVLTQGTGLAIESAYGLANTIQESGAWGTGPLDSSSDDDTASWSSLDKLKSHMVNFETTRLIICV